MVDAKSNFKRMVEQLKKSGRYYVPFVDLKEKYKQEDLKAKSGDDATKQKIST